MPGAAMRSSRRELNHDAAYCRVPAALNAYLTHRAHQALIEDLRH